MIPRTAVTWQGSDWQNALATAIRHPQELLEALNLPLSALPQTLAAAGDFSLRVPRDYVARMKKGDPHDPLLLQVLPAAEELTATPGYSADPVGELAAMPVPGLLHKYAGRALLITTGACAIHCRYCFRRQFPYAEAAAARTHWAPALAYLAADSSIGEIILSGGDPLLLTDQRLAELLKNLAAIPHLQRLRIHSRVPVVLPERITADLIKLLSGTRLRAIMIIHSNHANEINAPVGDALIRLAQAGITLMNQAVLLKGVNDAPEAQIKLHETLFGYGVLPYYLHLLDKVHGAAHFQIDRQQALDLYTQLRQQLPGYLLPRMVQEQAGLPYKVPGEHLEDFSAGGLM